MFMDLQVTPFSLWERELPKLIGDSRYQEIPNMKDRRAGFEEFCKKHAGSRKRQKLNAEPVHANGDSKDSAASKAKLLELLKESNSNQNTQMSDLEKKFKTDDRWKVNFWLNVCPSFCHRIHSDSKIEFIDHNGSKIDYVLIRLRAFILSCWKAVFVLECLKTFPGRLQKCKPITKVYCDCHLWHIARADKHFTTQECSSWLIWGVTQNIEYIKPSIAT